jgi:ribonuclease BN (tRNA processing enzyme)
VEIKILGTRGEIPVSKPKHRLHSGILFDAKLLFDLGEEEFLNLNPAAIFITHLHPDHAYFVRINSNSKIKRLIYSPDNFAPNTVKRVFGYKIRSIPTHHSKFVKSYAYLIEKESRVLYTGDLVWIDKKYHNLFKNLDLVITDGSFIREGGMIRYDKTTGAIYGHAGIPDLVRLFSRYTNKIIFVHFGSWFYKDIKEAKKKLEEIGKNYNTEVKAGFDGMYVKL